MTAPEAIRYLKPTEKAGALFLQRGIEGCVIMLNLLRLRSVTDYAAHRTAAIEDSRLLPLVELPLPCPVL